MDRDIDMYIYVQTQRVALGIERGDLGTEQSHLASSKATPPSADLVSRQCWGSAVAGRGNNAVSGGERGRAGVAGGSSRGGRSLAELAVCQPSDCEFWH